MSELDKAAETVFNVLFKCLPNEQAAARIRAKPAMLAETYKKLLPELKARAFTITGITRADALQSIRDRIAELPQGADWREIQKDILAEMSPYFIDPTAPPEVIIQQMAAAERRAELLIRHHGFQAYQAGAYDLMDRQRDVLPYWQYVTVGDQNVREEHAALDGLILPADSSFWNDHYPPWDWGCRCQVVPVDRDTFETIKAGDNPGRVLSERETKELEQNGRLAIPASGQVINVAARHGEGALQWHPTNLRIPLSDLEKNYDPDVFARFRDDMKAAKLTETNVTVWDWLNGSTLSPASASAILAPVVSVNTASQIAVALDSAEAAFTALNLTGKATWTPGDVEGLKGALTSHKAARLKDLLASPVVTGAAKTGEFSRKAVLKHVSEVVRMLPQELVQALSASRVRFEVAKSIGKNTLAAYNPKTKTILLSRKAIENLAAGGDLTATVRERVYHEMGHWVHMEGPAWYREAIDSLWAKRTSGEKMVKIPGYAPAKGKLDRWYDAYAGRDDYGTQYHGLEVVTRHFQLLANPRNMSHLMKTPNGDTIAENMKTVLSVFLQGK